MFTLQTKKRRAVSDLKKQITHTLEGVQEAYI